jgi:hypothetical protein
MEEILVAAGISLEQIHHGDGVASWAFNTSGRSSEATASERASRTRRSCQMADRRPTTPPSSAPPRR